MKAGCRRRATAGRFDQRRHATEAVTLASNIQDPDEGRTELRFLGRPWDSRSQRLGYGSAEHTGGNWREQNAVNAEAHRNR